MCSLSFLGGLVLYGCRQGMSLCDMRTIPARYQYVGIFAEHDLLFIVYMVLFKVGFDGQNKRRCGLLCQHVSSPDSLDYGLRNPKALK